MSLDTIINRQTWVSSRSQTTRSQLRHRLPTVLMAILLLLSFTTFVTAQDGANTPVPKGIDNKDSPADDDKDKKKDDTKDQPAQDNKAGIAAGWDPSQGRLPGLEKLNKTPSFNKSKLDERDFNDEEFLKHEHYNITIDSIYPSHGPTTGDTSVIVRGDGFAQFQSQHPEPKCKFGDKVVGAAYAPCTKEQPKPYELEGHFSLRTFTCIQCENSPPIGHNDTTQVSFKISLDGSFLDVHDSFLFWYYKPIKVTAIKPQMGTKDGGTTIQVWGENFFDYDDDSTCSFGTRSTKATVVNSHYLVCEAAGSDVVDRPMPVSVSLNGQQQSHESLNFWYYNDPAISSIFPDTGPEKGGNMLTLRGENFKPFYPGFGEIDISNSTYCYFTALGEFTKADIVNSTVAKCKAPASYYYETTAVELTLNAEDRTNDENIYHYYKPPFLFEAEPNQGPTKGGTKVKVVGTNFTDTGNITCRFGDITVPANRVSSSELTCVSPKVDKPGEVDLVIQVYYGLDSASVTFLYYKGAEVRNVSPPCGPLSGYTQLAVIGENFIDLGRDQIMCAFKQEDKSNFYLEGQGDPTILTNASIINDTFVYCDSPSLLNAQGYAMDSENQWFDVYVTLDGGSQLSDSNGRFEYYADPFINSLSPALGPKYGGTTVTVNGTGFDQNTTCGIVLRLGVQEFRPIKVTNESLVFKAPKSPLPGTSAFSVSLNGQQFSKQTAASNLAIELVYDYYEPPYTSYYYPAEGPSTGANPQRHQGFGYMLNRPHLSDRLWVRMFDANGSQPITEDIEIDSDNLHIDEWTWNLPPVKQPIETIMQITLNRQDWHDVINPETGKSYIYFQAPHVHSITPAFGHVKTTKDQVVEIAGTGFACYDEDCKDLMCRFGNQPDEYIYIRAAFASSTLIRCKVPQYTKPDVLNVEVTTNGESYTNDNKTYGYFDPFVLDANPKLLSTDGSTHVQIKGIGFVDSGQCKAAYDNRTSPVTCGGSVCSRSATFVDKNTLNTTSFPQGEVVYSHGGHVNWDPMYIDALVWGDQFTQNQVEVFYYDEPQLLNANINESPANLQSQLLLTVNFGHNDMGQLLRLGDAKCRFTSGHKVYVEEAQLVAYPFTQNRDPSLVNTVHCKTPRWQLDNDQPEQAQLDLSLNGQQWFGNYAFSFDREMHMHRDVPMSAPNTNSSATKIIGEGYRLHARTASIKWGLQTTEAMNMSSIQDYTYTHDAFLNSIPGSSALKAYEVEAARWPRVDTPLGENNKLDIVAQDNRFNDGQILGVAYLENGIDEVLNRDAGQTPWTIYTYEPSSVEFYAYRVPNVLKMFPSAGYSKGGTKVEVLGTWFDYAPQYGIVPHCKFGSTVVRAHFDSTVRLVCQSPPSPGTNAKLDFEVSLNGIDWTYTNFTFAYFDEPKMVGLYPDMGSIDGGELVYFVGEGFTNHTDPEYYKCRFTPSRLQLPPKESPVEFINSTTIKCPAPGGWPEGDEMIVQVTQNGIDYDEHNYKYSYYSVHRAFPRSGPSDGKAGAISVSGQGFRPNAGPLCRLNGTESKPLSVTHDTIRCKVPPAEAGPDYYGNVDFAISPNGQSWYPFDGGFQYYEQPTVEDIDPKMGPSEGAGVINFYGDNFRADYPNAELGCKIGSAKGKAQYVSERQVKCIVESMPMPAEDQDSLPAVVSLNSYSYTTPTEKTVFRPYGIRQLSPNSGPLGAGTTVVVTGQGFSDEPGVTPRCRFGTPANYAIVEAEILSYTRLACQTPDFLPQTPAAELPRDLPFSIALSQDEYDPWTKTSHVFRFYQQPVLYAAYPDELQVGRIAEVYVKAAEGSEFFEPLAQEGSSQKGTQTLASSTSMSGMRCKFGRFGEAQAIYVNDTFVKCTTPPFDDGADTIYKEYAPISVAMNGVDYYEEASTADFRFQGTAPFLSFFTIIIILAALALLGYAVAIYIEQRQKKQDAEAEANARAAAEAGGNNQ